jgi:FimV-like protein
METARVYSSHFDHTQCPTAALPSWAPHHFPTTRESTTVKTTLRSGLAFILASCFFAIFSVPRAFAASPDSSRVQQLLAQGDVYAEQTFDNRKALETYQAALALDTTNYEALWRISRAYIDIGEHQPAKSDQEKSEQLLTYEKALEFANKAVAANPNGSMGFARRAIANGRIALFKGVWESLDLVKQTRADCEKAIVLDSTNASAYYVLGRTHMKVSEKPRIIRWPLGLGWANLDDAVKNYEKAIELRPDFIMYRIDCARAYIELEKYDKARAHLDAIKTLPTLDEDDPQFRKEAQQLLDEIKGE